MLVPLVVRSSYSMGRGVVAPHEWAAAAKAAGLSQIALTDRNGLYGIPAFVEACEKAGLGAIVGTELVYEGGRAILIAGEKAGFSAISRLLTARAASLSANHAAFDARAAIVSSLGEAEPGDLFVLSDDEVLLGGQYGGEALFALVTQCNRASWRRLAATDRRPVAAPEASFLNPEQREVQRLLCAIDSQRCVHDIGEAGLDPPEALWGPAIDPASWSVLPPLAAWMEEAFASNALIAREALDKPFSGFVFPRYGMAEQPTALPRAAPDSPALLRALVLEGAARRYGTATAAVRERINYELTLIDTKGFCDYFLVVKDIVKRASRICGRGSAAASIVAYCLFITEVDPIRHNLYFERFLNPGRKDPPDIDVDFAWDERDALLAEVIEAYGPEHTARVANHNCFRSRSALRETARAFGMPDAEISSFEKALRVDKDDTLHKADSEWKKIIRLSASIVGLPRHLGTHSGGLIIVPDLLADHVPIEATGSGIRVTAWDKEGVETAGLVKIDLLGNRSLAVVRDALAAIAETGLPFDPGNWHPIDDPDTVSLLARGDTMGVFYVESPAMRLLQTKTGKGDFEHLVIHSSIIRPAANRYIDEYVDRLKGKPWKAFHPLLEGLFDESYGILCYQEDVSKAAIALAGFSSADADALRKILAKKDADTRLQEHWPAFLQGARSRGVDDASIQAVWDMMRSFSGYSFVKAHSASYAMLSFQSAFLRAHWPAQFMAAVMSNHGGFYSTLAYASESRRMGLRLLPPDINESGWRCRGGEGLIRFGFCMVMSLGKAAAEALLAERGRAGPYASVEDFARRIRFERTDAEALVGCGAFDSLLGADSRAGALMALLSICALREHQAPAVEGGQDPRIRRISGSLFSEDELDPGGSFTVARRGAADNREDAERHCVALSPRKRRQAEFKYLGTTLDCHPLELWPRLFAQPRLRARDLPRHVGRRIRLLAWPITAKPVLTSSEEPMEFVSFEDETAIFEAVLFPDAFKRFRHLLFEEAPLWVEGLVEKDRGALSLTIESIKKGE